MKNEKTPEAVLALARQFMESRILLSAAQLNIFTVLDQTPSTADELADRLSFDRRGLTILLDALAAMGLLVKEKNRYRCTGETAVFLTDDHPRSVLPMIRHLVNLWERWSGLTDRVRGKRAAESPPAASSGDDEMRAFIGAMHVIGMPLAEKIATAVGPDAAQNLIDVGGASGTYTIAFLKAAPQMKATLFDRPGVIPIAQERLAQAGLLDRVRLVAGDFDKDELPGGHDLALLSAIIHQNGPEDNIRLFKKAFRALAPGGRLIIRDHVMEPDHTRPREGAIFAVNMLVNTKGGTTFTFDEILSGLVEAGFQNIRPLQVGSRMDGLVEAFKP